MGVTGGALASLIRSLLILWQVGHSYRSGEVAVALNFSGLFSGWAALEVSGLFKLCCWSLAHSNVAITIVLEAFKSSNYEHF